MLDRAGVMLPGTVGAGIAAAVARRALEAE